VVTTRSFPGRYESLAKISKFIRGAAQKAGLGDFAVYSVEMAVDEACSNIIEHAYQGEDQGDISCTCKVSTEGLTIVLKDTGKPFSPDEVKMPDLNASLEERESHGLGLVFIYKWMDRVEFKTTPGDGNQLILFKSSVPSKGKGKKS
jgi:serine/threonine-protein kinase RsbW